MGGSSLCVALFLVTTMGCAIVCEGASGNNTIDYNEMGMKVLFDMVKTFLGDVVQTKRISESFLNLSTIVKGGDFQTDQLSDWKAWADYLIGYSVCVAFGILFIIFMPIAGLIFCCCRCCGKCGAKKKVQESKRAKCKRTTYCTILLILNTIMLAGVICSFMSNALLYKHLQNENDEGAVGNLKSAISNLKNFIDFSVEEAATYVYDEFDKISTNVLTKVNDSANNAVEAVLKEINATGYINEAKSISKEANKTKDELDKVSSDLKRLQDNSTQLANELEEIKKNVSDACPPGKCGTDFNEKFKIEANFSALGDLSEQASKVGEALNMETFIAEAEATIEEAKNKAKTAVKDQIKDASDTITSVNKSVTDGIKQLREKKEEALQFVPEADKFLDDANDDIKEYDEYIYYGGIGLSCAYLLIVALYYVGILFGLCGEKPGDGAQCCNTGVGANFLMAGVGFTFILSWILMIVCVIFFAVGGPMYTEVCRYFDGHDANEFKVFDATLRDGFPYFNEFPKNYSVSDSIKKCQDNQALYSSLNLDSIVNLDDIMDIRGLIIELQKLNSTTIGTENVTLINDDLKKTLNNFMNAGVDNIDFTEYFTQLDSNLTVTPLDSLANQIRNIPNQQNSAQLNQSAAKLEEMDRTTIPEMRQTVNGLKATLTNLQQKTIKVRVQTLIKNLEQAQLHFNTQKDVLIKQEISKLVDDIINSVRSEIDKIKDEIRNNMLPCEALSSAMYQMSDSVCILVLDSLNGMWFSYGWCLFFFIPCLVFAVLLVSQYRREHEYEKEFDDPNYSMYGGPNHDTIPLTSVERSYNPQGGRESYPAYRGQGPSRGMSNSGYIEDKPDYDEGRHYGPPPYDNHSRPGAWTGNPPSSTPSQAPGGPRPVARSNKVSPL